MPHIGLMSLIPILMPLANRGDKATCIYIENTDSKSDLATILIKKSVLILG